MYEINNKLYIPIVNKIIDLLGLSFSHNKVSRSKDFVWMCEIDNNLYLTLYSDELIIEQCSYRYNDEHNPIKRFKLADPKCFEKLKEFYETNYASV